MKAAAAAILGVLALAAFAPTDPPAFSDEGPALPCTNPAARLSNSPVFQRPFHAARQAMEAEHYEEGFELARAAAASARSQQEVLEAVRLQQLAFSAIGDRAGVIRMMREQVRLGEMCPGLITAAQLEALRTSIPVFEHLLAGGTRENYRSD